MSNFTIENSTSFRYLTTAAESVECAAYLAQQHIIAIDLEFDKNRFGYGFNLCLMQIATADRCYLIDPLLDVIDVTLFFPVLENPTITKVTFAFGEDIRLLHHLGCFPKGIYDLSFASALLDFPPSSLSALLLEILEIDTGKSSQQSNWLARPITNQQCEYAANDVKYLIELHHVLGVKAEEKGISDWIAQENESFESANYENENHNNVIKEKDKGDLSFFEWHLFCRLMEYREEKAKQLNEASHSVIQKSYIQELARNPDRVSSWMRIRTTTPSLKTLDIQSEVESLLTQASQEAADLDLSKTKKAIYSQSKEEYLRIKRENKIIDQAKKQVFKPIQTVISEQFGKNAQTFILSNRLIKELVQGNLQNYLPYKQSIIESLAKNLNVSLDEVIGSIDER